MINDHDHGHDHDHDHDVSLPLVQPSPPDWQALRDRLADERGPRFWRSLDELVDAPDFRAYVEAEFPSQAPQMLDPVGRRSFLKLMGASVAFAGLSACTRQPTEKIFPYVKAPELIIPGEPLYFASAMPMAGGFANGLLVESHMGRPTKIEGNPDHPTSLGATDLLAQASVLTLYDPDRSQVLRHLGEIETWANFNTALAALLAGQQAKRGAGLRILSGPVTSPTVAAQAKALAALYPDAVWHQYEPISRDNLRAAARRAFGTPVQTQYRFDRAARVLSLDADFLGGSGPGELRSIREFVRRRKAGTDMNRLYVAETTPSNTGAMADHRLPLAPNQVLELTLAIARAVGLPVRDGQGVEPYRAWVDAVAKDLQQHRGASVVVAGEWQPVGVHLLAHAINNALGNVGSTVIYTDSVEANPVDETTSLRSLVEAMDAGQVDVLLILDANPAYDAPADLQFAERLNKVGIRIHYGLYVDETAALCHWHVPAAHYLESWADTRAYDGTATVIQPLIAPLYEGKTTAEVLAAMLGTPAQSAHDLVRAHWQQEWGAAADFEARWRKAVHDGVVAGTTLPPASPNFVSGPASWSDALVPAPVESGTLQLVFRPDSSVYDGRFANNGWLQEVPRPLTRLTWDNAALMAPATAERLGVASEDVVNLTVDGRSLHAPVWVMPGHAPDAVTLHLGYGRRQAGRVGDGVGVDAYALRTSTAPWTAAGLKVDKTGARHQLACTQHHFSMEGRDLVHSTTLAELSNGHGAKNDAHGEAAAHGEGAHGGGHGGNLSMYPPHPYNGYSWGMAVDLNNCVGCNACVVACVSENNIPVVGKDQVARGREMQWIRIDRYYEGGLENPNTHHQPVFCQHCELAPCEVVCPVNATVHDSEGLNAMVYNRCVGTRYCSNNCPYKVRRFNFTLFNHPETDTLKMLQNPDVTVRSRGVMEKCTYCLQRINHSRIQAEREGRKIRDGELLTACQQVCPAEALVFGDINDPNSKVAKLKQEERNYSLLGELGVKPRTTYLASVKNPNPELASTPGKETHG